MQIWQPNMQRVKTPSKRVLPRGTEPDHYHIIYSIRNVSIPWYKIAYRTMKEAFTEVKRLGDASEPNTEWYDDGRVAVEKRIRGRTGLYWVELEVAGCIRNRCRPRDSAGVDNTPVSELLVLD